VKRAVESLAYYAGFLVGGLWFLICSFLGVVWLLLAPRNRQTLYVYGKVFCRGVVRLMGWRIDVANRPRMDEFRPCVFVANHQSFLDVVTFGSVFPPRTVSAGKREIGRIPIFGWFYRLSGNLVIDRANPRDARDSLDAAARTIREEAVSVWFMPEGHRNTGPELLPFKTGAFRLALAARVPVVPIVAEPLGVIADTKMRRARPGVLRVTVLEPVTTDGPEPASVAQLASTVRARMQEELDRLRASGRGQR
jgi:1-acyl-sn-glycerol-3-phosphate acyltransferase